MACDVLRLPHAVVTPEKMPVVTLVPRWRGLFIPWWCPRPPRWLLLDWPRPRLVRHRTQWWRRVLRTSVFKKQKNKVTKNPYKVPVVSLVLIYYWEQAARWLAYLQPSFSFFSSSRPSLFTSIFFGVEPERRTSLLLLLLLSGRLATASEEGGGGNNLAPYQYHTVLQCPFQKPLFSTSRYIHSPHLKTPQK